MSTEKRFFEFIEQQALSVLSLKTSADSIEAASKMIAAIVTSSGTVITTGMGKAGHIAAKVTSTLCSLGIPPVYLHPGEASHGDIGIVQKGSLLFVFSNSGRTKEVLQTIGLGKKLGCSGVLFVTSHSKIARKHADVVVDIGVRSEAGHLKIAPTTSTLCMLVVGDFIALEAAVLLGTTLSDFALRHHGGYLGAKSRRLLRQKKAS